MCVCIYIAKQTEYTSVFGVLLIFVTIFKQESPPHSNDVIKELVKKKRIENEKQ
jgi:hypothetical protein